MITMKITTTSTEEVQIDLRSMPVTSWPEKLQRQITLRMMKQAKQDLFPREYLAARIENLYDLCKDFSLAHLFSDNSQE